MELNKIIDKLDDNEKKIYWNHTASEYFRNIYYSRKFSPILKKLNTQEKLTDDEWNFLVDRLFLVTCKAVSEEDNVQLKDKLIYALCKIGLKFSSDNSYIYNECYKMVEFINSITMEKDINNDLVVGLNLVNNSNNDDTLLNELLQQHREALVFRDNQDCFYEAYEDSYKGHITESERGYINSMNRSYIREKNLVNKSKK